MKDRGGCSQPATDFTIVSAVCCATTNANRSLSLWKQSAGGAACGCSPTPYSLLKGAPVSTVTQDKKGALAQLVFSKPREREKEGGREGAKGTVNECVQMYRLDGGQGGRGGGQRKQPRTGVFGTLFGVEAGGEEVHKLPENRSWWVEESEHTAQGEQLQSDGCSSAQRVKLPPNTECWWTRADQMRRRLRLSGKVTTRSEKRGRGRRRRRTDLCTELGTPELTWRNSDQSEACSPQR